MIITTSWDDGDILDERVADLLDRHGIRGTFYVTRRFRPHRLPDERIRALATRHEIGGHTLSHPDLTRLSRAAKENEIASGKKWLEDVTGKTVAMFCYPFGRFDTETKASVAKAGFKGARTTRQFVLARQPDRFALATTLHAHPMVLRCDNARDFGAYILSSTGGANRWRGSLGVVTSMLRGWPRFAEALFRRAARDPDAVFHLWGHSWEIEASNMWGQLDSFLRCVSSVDARFETNEEVQQPRH
jgi:peptidoglycan/xylan/chitin deacetylase (PgdA/CDA1 family)